MQNQMKPSNECGYALSIWNPGGGTQQMFIRGGSAPRSKHLSFLYTIFDSWGSPFVYLLLTNDTPFTYLV